MVSRDRRPPGLAVTVALAVGVAASPAAHGERSAAETNAGGGLFVSSCRWSHSAYDDPILRPGRPGHSHRHDFFGNRATNARSTASGLRRRPSNCSIDGDRAAYWAPSLFKGARVVRPSRFEAWYVNEGAGPAIRPFPPGLKMIAGNPRAKRFPDDAVAGWSCGDDLDVGPRIPSCRRRGVRLRIAFPSCWDGERRDSRDHRRHMSYRRWDTRRGASHCPRSHPVAVPQLVLYIQYPLRNGRGVWLASGRVRTAHADFFNGWRRRPLARLTRRCLARSRLCARP